ncbi:hypothetical protein MYXO_02616 [Myxococcaceae bacterium]|nr:hypothetical protein MYXO_02616 [Myxococcaceae bacterium]
MSLLLLLTIGLVRFGFGFLFFFHFIGRLSDFRLIFKKFSDISGSGAFYLLISVFCFYIVDNGSRSFFVLKNP